MLSMSMQGEAVTISRGVCLRSHFLVHDSVYSCRQNGCHFEMPIVDVKSHSNVSPIIVILPSS